MIDTDKYEDELENTIALPITVYEMAVGLLAEVKRLREGIKGAIYLFQEAGNPKMSDKKRLDVICDALLEVIE